MYNSMFGAGQGSAAFAYDMLVMEDIEKQKDSNPKNGTKSAPTNTNKKVGGK